MVRWLMSGEDDRAARSATNQVRHRVNARRGRAAARMSLRHARIGNDDFFPRGPPVPARRSRCRSVQVQNSGGAGNRTLTMLKPKAPASRGLANNVDKLPERLLPPCSARSRRWYSSPPNFG